MQVNAHLAVDLVAVEQSDQLTLMLEVAARVAPRDVQRPIDERAYGRQRTATR